MKLTHPNLTSTPFNTAWLTEDKVIPMECDKGYFTRQTTRMMKTHTDQNHPQNYMYQQNVNPY